MGKHFTKIQDDEEIFEQEKLHIVTQRNSEEMEEKFQGSPLSIAKISPQNTRLHKIVILGSRGVGKTAITAQVLDSQPIYN